MVFDREEFEKNVDEGLSTSGYPFTFWIKQRRILINLIVMAIVWFAASFDYYLI